ncbi:hypothetical protein ABNX05_13005 [Lysinibacillus sp. M3]|uniref:Uncharacterized protein n=1 Tax=Lysinibacillus zambalensis TaxID=3160866 RepID=A0ABV1MSQ7_9BACI
MLKKRITYLGLGLYSLLLQGLVHIVFKSSTFYKNEIDKTDVLIGSIGYTETPLVRPPYGKKLIGLPFY